MTTNQPNTNPAPATTEGTTPAMPYHYYLSIIEFNGPQIRTADLELSRAKPIRTMDDVKNVKQWLRKEFGFVNPQVAFSLLRNDVATRKGQR